MTSKERGRVLLEVISRYNAGFRADRKACQPAITSEARQAVELLIRAEAGQPAPDREFLDTAAGVLQFILVGQPVPF